MVTVLITVTITIMVTVIVTTTTTVEDTTARSTVVGVGTIVASVAREPGLEPGNLLFERRDALYLVGVLGLGLLILFLKLVADKADRSSRDRLVGGSKTGEELAKVDQVLVESDYDGLQDGVEAASRDILVVVLDDLAQGLVVVHEKSVQGHTRVGGDVMKRLKIGNSSPGAKLKRGPRERDWAATKMVINQRCVFANVLSILVGAEEMRYFFSSLAPSTSSSSNSYATAVDD
jgi:hypothetical protein